MKNLITSFSLIIAIGLNSLALCQESSELNNNNNSTEPGTLTGSFSVSATGAAVYSIPLDVPSGRAGMNPNLALVYNSQQGGNILGKGWGLAGFSSISRTNPTIYYNGQPDNIDFEDDQLILDGQKMIPISEHEYRLENDPSLKIEYLDGDNGEFFRVHLANGITKEYGNSEDSRQVYIQEGPDVCPLIWHINKIIDPQGNTILYEYLKDISEGELHPSGIKYTGFEQNGSNTLEGFYSIRFHYENLNNPALKQTFYCQKGTNEYKNLTSSILTSIEISLTAENEPFQEYIFNYKSNTLWDHTNVLDDYFLSEILLKSNLEVDEKTIKGASFDWAFYQPAYETINPDQQDHDISWHWQGYYPLKVMCKINITGSNKDDIAVSKKIFENDEWKTVISIFYDQLGREIVIPTDAEVPIEPIAMDIDFNGDEELVFRDYGGLYIYDFTPDESGGYVAFLKYYDVSTGQIKCGDIDGDGNPDIILLKENPCTLYKGTGDPNNLFTIQDINVPFENTNEFATLADFNGDGKSDILLRDFPDLNYRIYSYNANSEFELISSLNYSADDENILPSYVDLNNDGKTDICFTKTNSFAKDCYFSFGEGFTQKISGNLGIIPSLVMDMNNDGIADYIKLYGDGTTLNIQYGMPDGFSVSRKYPFDIELPLLEIIDGIYNMVLADIDGNGVQDLVTEFYETVDLDERLNEAPNPINPRDSIIRPIDGHLLKLYLLRDNGFSKDLINSFKDGFGKEMKVTYKPANQNPATYGDYPLKKSTDKNYLVNSTWVPDGITNLNVMKYSYGIPLLHCLGKGSLGFTNTSVKNEQNQTITHTHFSVYDEGSSFYFNFPDNVTVYTLINNNQQGLLLMDMINSIDVKVFQNSSPPIFRPIPTRSIKKMWDNDESHSFISSSASFLSTEDIDNYGNVLKSISCADKDPLDILNTPEDYEFINTQTAAYIIDEANWLISRVASVETVTQSEDDPVDNKTLTEFAYYEPGEFGGKGVENWPLLKQKTVTPNMNNLLALQETYKYDKYGNLSELAKAAPNSSPALPEILSAFEYDENFEGRFLTEQLEGSGNQPFITQKSFDEKTGQLRSVINPQGLETLYHYDCFGRIIEIEPPDHIDVQTKISWCESGENPPPEAVYSILNNKMLNNTMRTESEPVRTYYNKFRQDILTVTKGLNGSTIYTQKLYDSKGRLWKVSEPYFSNETPNNWVEYNYDDLGRIETTILPENSIHYSYHGRSTTTTDQGTGISVTKTIDALGNNIEISDPSGTIVYNYLSSGLVKSINVSGTLSEMSYDAAGNQIALVDPDAGTTQYTYNAYGMLTEQQDANGNSFTFSYDELNRLSEKSLFGVGSQARYSYYDVPLTPNYGLPESIEGTDNIRYTYDYDYIGRVQRSIESIDGATISTRYAYSDITGKLETITYPSAFQIQNSYDELSGILSYVKDISANKILWQLNSVNARGQITEYRLGNDLFTYKSYDEFGFPRQISTVNYNMSEKSGNMKFPGKDIEEYIQDLRYNFDPVTGNLLSRASSTDELHLSENFQYDDLLYSRLSNWQVSGGEYQIALYFDNGNIKTKTGITSFGKYSSEYRYGSDAGPHAVTGVTIPSQEFQQHSTPQDIVYTAFNKIREITQFFPAQGYNPGDKTWDLNITYGPDEQRKITRLSCNHELIKTKYFSSGLYEEEHFGHTIRKLNYIYAGDGLFAIYVMNGGNDTMYYIHKDYQGSYDVITDEEGNIVERLSFDPWGRRRNPTNWTYSGVPSSYLFDRGYTGHEHLDVFSLINMNGRCYDPWLGRFLSPDPVVQSPGYSQSYNRYSYCVNNPLKYIDPSGYLVDRHPNDWSQSASCWYYNPNFTFHSMFTDNPSDPGSFSYNWSTGNYENSSGYVVSWNEVFTNYVVPNSSSHYLDLINTQSQENNSNKNLITQNQQKLKNNFLANVYDVLLNPGGMMFEGTLDGLLQSIEDGRVNLINSDNPVYEILEIVAINKSISNLYDIIIPNYYGQITIVGRCYSKKLTLEGREYKIFVLGYNEHKDRSFYDIYKKGFGYLDPIGHYEPSPKLNEGYSYGLYIIGYYGLNLITIGASNTNDYNYLISIYKSFKFQ